jgi:8-oxo-dGTP pyrophosphatase MutT (NUDIX family)
VPRDEKPRLLLPPFEASVEFTERAKAFRAAGVAAAPAKPSATVLLLRDSADGLEVFLIRRQVSMQFAGGMHVFPGGGVDAADRVGRDDDAALVTAAIRETFEESGVLFATGRPVDPALLEADRIELVEHRTTFDEVLAKHRLAMQPDWLRPWARWVTPDFEPRRYDTLFFVATARPGQEARDTGGESDAAQWITPAKALVAREKRDWLLMPPTAQTLRELLPFATAEAAFEAAVARDLTPRHGDIDVEADPPMFVFWTAG